jgi:hypothetical protein
MVEDGGLPARLSPEDERCFPTLCVTGYRVESPKDVSYNCIAYVVGDKTRHWSPTVLPIPGYYWPPNARRDDHPDALKSVFEAEGYEICTDGDLEEGYEKIALYVDKNGEWTHAAKQEINGEWSSKLGDEEDIRHKTPHCFSDAIYGEIAYFMRRHIVGKE